MITTTPRTFSQTPAFIIWGSSICPEPKTMALGGVATGIMKAQLAAMVAGKIRR